jgi:hypothetical protein
MYPVPNMYYSLLWNTYFFIFSLIRLAVHKLRVPAVFCAGRGGPGTGLASGIPEWTPRRCWQVNLCLALASKKGSLSLTPAQGCGSGFVSGSAWIRITLRCWIRIRIHIAGLDPDPGGQKWPKKIEKSTEFHVLKAEGFSCSLGVLFGSLGIS